MNLHIIMVDSCLPCTLKSKYSDLENKKWTQENKSVSPSLSLPPSPLPTLKRQFGFLVFSLWKCLTSHPSSEKSEITFWQDNKVIWLCTKWLNYRWHAVPFMWLLNPSFLPSTECNNLSFNILSRMCFQKEKDDRFVTNRNGFTQVLNIPKYYSFEKKKSCFTVKEIQSSQLFNENLWIGLKHQIISGIFESP